MVMYRTDTRAALGQRGLGCQMHPGHRLLFAIVRSGVGHECREEQHPQTGDCLLHGYSPLDP